MIEALFKRIFPWHRTLCISQWVRVHISLTQLRLLAAFATRLVRILRYLFGGFQNVAEGPGGITLGIRSCAKAQMKWALRVMEGIAAKCAARGWVLLLDEHIIAAIHSFDGILILALSLGRFASQVTGQNCTQRSLSESYYVTEADLFRGAGTF